MESLQLLRLVFGILISLKSEFFSIIMFFQDDSLLRIVRIGVDEKRNLATTIFLQVIKSAAATRIKNVESSSSLEDFEVIVDETEKVQEASSSEATVSTQSNDVSWIYPLVPGASPCYRTEYNAFILPDLQS